MPYVGTGKRRHTKLKLKKKTQKTNKPGTMYFFRPCHNVKFILTPSIAFHNEENPFGNAYGLPLLGQKWRINT